MTENKKAFDKESQGERKVVCEVNIYQKIPPKWNRNLSRLSSKEHKYMKDLKSV